MDGLGQLVLLDGNRQLVLALPLDLLDAARNGATQGLDMALAATGIHLVLSFNHSLLHLALSGLGTEHSAVHRRRVKFLGALLEHNAGRGLHTVHERQRGGDAKPQDHDSQDDFGDKHL